MSQHCRRFFYLIALLIGFSFHAVQAQSDESTTVVVHAGTLLAVPGQPPLENMSLLIKDGKITEVLAGFVKPESNSAAVINLRQQFVLPGLMDAHVHILAQPSAFIRHARKRGGPMTRSNLTMNAVVYAQRTRAAGFTTVRDLGSNDESVFAVRDAINDGDIPGPRILAAGPMISATGGHGDRGIRASESMTSKERMREGVCDGPDECVRLVRHLKKLGADVIKFAATGGFMSDTGTRQQYELVEMQAIVNAARQRHMRVAAHAYDNAAIINAINAGVDSIEHGWLLDENGIRLMKKRGTFLVPTLLISRLSPLDNMAGPGGTAKMRDDARAFEQAYAAGVNIAFGTDVGMFDHGQNALEFDIMVEFGMSEADAIRSATVKTAELFGLTEELGTLEAGKLADLIALDENPLERISALHSVNFVMKNGEIVKQNGRFIATVPVNTVGKPVSLR
jgi:imidazolonepropionase-like amidohydrolase